MRTQHQPPEPLQAAAEALARVPEHVHDAVRWYIAWRQASAYQQGYQQALNDIASRTAELNATDRHTGRRTYQQAITDRIAQLRAGAKAAPDYLRGNTWRGDYPGGRVDFHTGRLLADPTRPTPAELHAGQDTLREAA